MYHRLLVPLDGSRLAEAVLPLVTRMAVALGATAVLLHVLERGAPGTVHGERHLQGLAEADSYLHDVAARLQVQGVAVETHAHEAPVGDVPASISRHVLEERGDLIIMCTHGSGGVRQLLFGSIAQQVLKRGNTPVLLVRAEQALGNLSFEPHTILVPLDASAAAEAALEPAGTLASHLGSSVHLVTVVATPGTMSGDRQAVAQVLPAATRVALDLEEAEANEYLESAATRLRSTGISVTTEVRRGDASHALAGEAAEPGVGLVVVATHGRAGVQAIWAGSVTARLLARTRSPILLLRTIET
jgi:nucleotide-binding universal stress UspA family protein